jgi:hypothetical protein
MNYSALPAYQSQQQASAIAAILRRIRIAALGTTLLVGPITALASADKTNGAGGSRYQRQNSVISEYDRQMAKFERGNQGCEHLPQLRRRCGRCGSNP